jgi:uncharacterized protein (DUF1499 family)
MITALKWLLVALLGGSLAVLLGAQFGLLRGAAPEDLGVRDGRLKRPSKTPNSVSSQADLWPDHPRRHQARIAPLALRGDGPATMAQLQAICAAMPGAHVVTQQPDYLYVQFETRLMKFVDDLELWLDPAQQVVQVRSASRIGHGDRGVNRARVEAIRARLQAG